MQKLLDLIRIPVVLMAATSLFMAGCSGNTDGGTSSSEDFTDTAFVANDTTAGTISVTVDQSSLAVSETTNFSVVATNSSGQPVPQMQVICDTDSGLAIIEPNTGSELTDSFGHMSGVVGCESPGSFQMACRLPIGVNKRQFVSINCTGTTPVGFDGFPGSAGGNLGGGVDDYGDGGVGGTDTSGVQITEILIYGVNTTEGSNVVDTYQNVCDPTADPIEYELFGDNNIGVKVVNSTNQNIKFTSLQYSVPDGDGSGNLINSGQLSLIGDASALTVLSEGGENQFFTFFAVFSNTRSISDMLYAGTSTYIPYELGVRNVTVRLTGKNGLGETVTVSARTAVSFKDYGYCD